MGAEAATRMCRQSLPKWQEGHGQGADGQGAGEPLARARKVFDREEVLSLRKHGLSIAKIGSLL